MYILRPGFIQSALANSGIDTGQTLVTISVLTSPLRSGLTMIRHQGGVKRALLFPPLGIIVKMSLWAVLLG